MKIPFKCKYCGSETLKTRSKPKSLDDLDGAICAQCGTVVSKDDIKAQAQKIAEDLVRDTLRKAGFKQSR